MSNKINMLEISLDDVDRKRSALSTMLAPMDVPEMRRDVKNKSNLRWLQRNLAIQNCQHSLFKSAMDLVNWLVVWNIKHVDVGGKDFPSGF